jgi:hypothetical protein
MSSVPPEEPPQSPPPPPPPPEHQHQHQHQHGPGYTGLGRSPVGGAILPVPGNAEFAVWIVAEIVIAIVAGVSDRVDAAGWVTATIWLTAAYIISRGIAKASRVLEQ